MIGFLALAGLAAASDRALAEEGVPDVASWAKEVVDVGGAFPRRIAFVASLPEKGQGAPVFLELDAAEFNKLGFFQTKDSRDLAWDMKLNASRFADRDPYDVVVELTGADTLVVAPESGSWSFVRKSGDGRDVVLEAKAPKSRTPKAIAAWLPSALGWDGVVLARKDDFLLVGSTVAILSTPDIQALAVSSSADKFGLRASERQGAGLLGLAETKDGVGVFDIVLLGQGVTEIPVGTKLIIEKKKAKKKP